MATAIRKENEKEIKTKNASLVTADGKLFFIKRMDTGYYAILDGQVIASGETRKFVKEEAQQYTSPKTLKKYKNINIGLTSPITLATMVKNNEISVDQIKSYYYLNYNEDISILEEKLNIAVKQYCMAKYFDNNLEFEKSLYYKKFENEILIDINYNDFKTIMTYIINTKSLIKSAFIKIKEEMDKI